MNLTVRLTRINANRARLQHRIARKRERRESTAADRARLVRETTAELRVHMRLEKESA